MENEAKVVEEYVKFYENSEKITLEFLAVPETVKISLYGEEIIPQDFDIYGAPILTSGQRELIAFKIRNHNLKNSRGRKKELKITYQKREFDVPKESFDSAKGIEMALNSVAGLEKVILNRKLFSKLNKKESLKEFVLFGRYLITKTSSIITIYKEDVIINGNVEEYESFKKNQKGNLFYEPREGAGYIIPKAGTKCFYCSKKVELSDLKLNPWVGFYGHSSHKSCFEEYLENCQVSVFMDIIEAAHNIDGEKFKYSYDVIKSENFVFKEATSRQIPKVMFHTPNGDILIGKSKDVDCYGTLKDIFLIEWQENYKYFDFEKAFDNTKCRFGKGKERYIFAWNEKEASEYIRKALENIT